MLDIVIQILGSYQPNAGEGIASLNFTWLVGAVLFCLLVWFIMKLVLRLIGGSNGRGR